MRAERAEPWPGSTGCSAMTKPTRWRAWRMSGANSWTSSPHRAVPSPKRSSAGLRFSIPSRRRSGAWHPKTAWRCVRPGQNRFLINLKSGCMRSCPGYQASLPWPRPSAMPWAGCRRRGHISATATWIWTTTRPCSPLVQEQWSSAERAVKPVAIGRKNWMFSGSEGGGKAMAIAFTLIETAKLNNVDPQAWLTWVLGQIADYKITRLAELLPWRYAASAA